MVQRTLSTTIDLGSSVRFHAVLLSRTAYEVAYVAPCGLIGFAFESQSGFHSFGSDRRTPYRTRPNSLAFIPAGCDVYSQSDCGGEYLLIRAAAWKPPAARRFNDVMLPSAVQAAAQIRRQMLNNPTVGSRALAESMSTILAAVSCFCDPAHREPDAARWITARRLRLIDELIEAHIDDRVTVADLAACLDLSTGFFIRAFRAYVGQSPHAYVMERRLAKARILLTTSTMSLTAVAAACGFANHAHMSTVFKRTLNVAPSALQRSRAEPPTLSCYQQGVATDS
jgi:AraC family transcriptional regulator